MAGLKDQFAQDLDRAFYNTAIFADLIQWDNVEIAANVLDPEEKAGDLEAGIIRQTVAIRKNDISIQPRFGDQVLLKLDPAMVDGGEYWTVGGVKNLWHEWEVSFYRYVA
jgi:hypothetical protein